MTTKVAPWLEGLSEAWELPQKPASGDSVSSASHDASSIRSTASGISRRSLSGLPSSLRRQNSTSYASTQRRRKPLAPLTSNETNTLCRQNGSTRLAGTRSVSEESDPSLLACGTVQQRSKSASPVKHQETLEWKRRLVRGQVGYGDQTDLFGPSGLENIFAKSKGAENEMPRTRGRMNWIQKSDVQMPSSPPPWPSDFAASSQPNGEEGVEGLHQVPEEDQEYMTDVDNANESFLSNPFDLEDSKDFQEDHKSDRETTTPCRSSPDKAFIEPTEDEGLANGTVSGQTEIEQEDFSPVFISKHHTVSGQVDYAALDSHMVRQFQSMKVNLRHPSQKEASQPTPGSGNPKQEAQEQSNFSDGPESHSLPVMPDLSFSENLSTGSPFPNLGKNVQLRRGGYSQCGSFKQRPLSPSQSVAENTEDPAASGLLSLPPSDIGQLPPAPTPPKTPRAEAHSEEPKSRSSGSPLKLFGNHDTFTNNRLLRRLSQLNPDGTLRQPNANLEKSEEARRASSFGSGELDHHAFDAEITITSASDSDNDDSDRSPGSEIPPPGSKIPVGFRFESSPEMIDTFKLKRKLSKHSTAASKKSTLDSQQKLNIDRQPTVEDMSESQLQNGLGTEQVRTYGEGKRPPTSPFKNPTPKRRRTLHASELENEIACVNNSYHSQLQEAVSSRKRKDARNGESQNTAEPDILAQRKILRPRNPTPSQRRREQIEAELREAAEEFAEQEPGKLEAVMEQIESSMASDATPTLQQQAHALASEVASFTFKLHKPSGDQTERKRSVTTQDFLNEAMMVMNLIRAKARPQSNLGSVEESDGEALALSEQGSAIQQDGSLLRVSRPPSREGSGWRQRLPVPTDARVVSHLRRFQEKEDREDTDFIANSIASLQIDDEAHVNDQVVVVDEHFNIRISGPPADHDREEHESDTRPLSQRSQGSTLNTQNSGNTSTEQTIGTSSTRKSENVGTLAPDAVAHLIGEQVGGMTFDRDQQRWVRVSKSPGKVHGSFLELPSNVTSDDDPFREISDLPVDEQGELRRISAQELTVDNADAAKRTISIHDQVVETTRMEQVVESRTSSQETVLPRPVTRDSSHIRHQHSSSVPSRYTAFASSQQEKVETRATSWSDEELAKMSALGRARQLPPPQSAPHVPLGHRNPLDNARESPTRKVSTVKRPLIGAHTVPGDIASVDRVQPKAPAVNENGTPQVASLREVTELDLAESDEDMVYSPKVRQTPFRSPLPKASAYRTGTRQMSLRQKTLRHRFDPETQEQSELSIIAPLPGDRMVSVSLSVSRPLSARTRQGRINELQSSPSKVGSSFMLSDLPDFTVHDVDAERPSERALANRLAQHAAAEVDDRYALAVKELVKILTDVNEDEPFWEDLKQLDLHSRSLASLHGLQDFCAHVQEIDVSNNVLGQLHGAPVTVRRLNARSNQLSSLTSWNHLMNLQYLDVSNNQLDNLDGLGTLVHLRELRADDNDITRLDGVFELDGLLKLQLRRNKLQYLDFELCQLHRLTSLDLCGNQITGIDHLHKLESLDELKLDGNDLKSGLKIERAMTRVTTLSLQHCGLEHLEVASFPALQNLNVDDNRLAHINDLSQIQNLRVLSMQRQSLPEDETISVLDGPLDAHVIRLSGNKIPLMNLSTNFLSVRHLELASVGLTELPNDFGLRMPNLRTLNLNFNSLKDIRPLLNIERLEKLTVCGNRLHRLRKSVATFSKMVGLQTLDLRDNPLTLGFYANIASTLSRHTSVIRRVNDQATTDEDEETAEYNSSRYEFPPRDAGQDLQHRTRLDEDTKLRQRVYEMLLTDRCQSLNVLDGHKLDRKVAATKDSTWDRLVELGIVRRSHQEVPEFSGWDM